MIASYHGLPQSYFEKGDPYHCHCQKTSRLLRERLGWREGRLLTTFQSRFGPEEWLQPYTDETVERLAQGGREADRGRQSRLRLRLPGDAGGDRRAESRDLPATMAASDSRTSPA